MSYPLELIEREGDKLIFRDLEVPSYPSGDLLSYAGCKVTPIGKIIDHGDLEVQLMRGDKPIGNPRLVQGPAIPMNGERTLRDMQPESENPFIAIDLHYRGGKQNE